MRTTWKAKDRSGNAKMNILLSGAIEKTQLECVLEKCVDDVTHDDDNEDVWMWTFSVYNQNSNRHMRMTMT